jgi:hypothetical protein
MKTQIFHHEKIKLYIYINYILEKNPLKETQIPQDITTP